MSRILDLQKTEMVVRVVDDGTEFESTCSSQCSSTMSSQCCSMITDGTTFI